MACEIVEQCRKAPEGLTQVWVTVPESGIKSKCRGLGLGLNEEQGIARYVDAGIDRGDYRVSGESWLIL